MRRRLYVMRDITPRRINDFVSFWKALFCVSSVVQFNEKTWTHLHEPFLLVARFAFCLQVRIPILHAISPFKNLAMRWDVSKIFGAKDAQNAYCFAISFI